jgi:hypothetical protein
MCQHWTVGPDNLAPLRVTSVSTVAFSATQRVGIAIVWDPPVSHDAAAGGSVHPLPPARGHGFPHSSLNAGQRQLVNASPPSRGCWDRRCGFREGRNGRVLGRILFTVADAVLSRIPGQVQVVAEHAL